MTILMPTEQTLNLLQEDPAIILKAVVRIATVRVGAVREYPMIGRGLYAMTPIPVWGLRFKCGAAWSMDKYARLYFDPEVIAGNDPEVLESIECCIASFIHETWHWLRRHPERVFSLPFGPNGEAANKTKANWAMDAEINGNDPYLRQHLPEGCIFPETLTDTRTGNNFPRDTWETFEFFYKWMEWPENTPPPPPPPPCKNKCPACGAPASSLTVRPLPVPVPGRAILSCDSCGYEQEIELQKGKGKGEDDPTKSELPPEEGEKPDSKGGSPPKEQEEGEEKKKEEQGKGEGEEEEEKAGKGEGEEEEEKESAKKKEIPGKNNPLGRDLPGTSEGRDWELPPPTENGEIPGIQPGDDDSVRKAVARDIQQSGVGCGSLPGNWASWAGTEVSPPKIPWQSKLQQFIRESRDKTLGASNFTYSKRSRRQSCVSGNVILPAVYRPRVEVAVVIDTSGSMSDKDLDACCSECSGILRAVGASAMVVTGDTRAGFAKKVTTVANVKLLGRGGTDMRPLITEALTARPQCVVVLTDGFTPWPGPQDVRVPIVVCLIGRNCGEDRVPSWMHTIVVED